MWPLREFQLNSRNFVQIVEAGGPSVAGKIGVQPIIKAAVTSHLYYLLQSVWAHHRTVIIDAGPIHKRDHIEAKTVTLF